MLWFPFSHLVYMVLKALDGGQIRPFDRAAADLSPRLSWVWLQPRLTVKATHWLITPFVLEIISI